MVSGKVVQSFVFVIFIYILYVVIFCVTSLQNLHLQSE